MKDTLQVNIKALAALCESNYIVRSHPEFLQILRKWIQLFYPALTDDETEVVLSNISVHYRTSEDKNDYYVMIGDRFFYKTFPAEMMIKGRYIAEILLCLSGYMNFILATNSNI